MNTFNAAIVVLLRKRVNSSIGNNSATLQAAMGFYAGVPKIEIISMDGFVSGKWMFSLRVKQTKERFTNLIENETAKVRWRKSFENK